MELYKKLFKAKQEIGAISKDSSNPFFKSKYFDINSLIQHVEPILTKHGLMLLQPLENGKVVSQILNPDDGESVYSSIELPNLNDPQKMGSAVTYYRRYTLQSLLALQAEDDDGNLAAKKKVVNEKDIKLLQGKLATITNTPELTKYFGELEANYKTNKEVVRLFTEKKIELQQA